MAEANAVVGQTYNAKQQKVYPKVVAQSFVVDSEVDGSSEEFNSVVKDTISRMDELTPQKITLGINGSIVVRNENNVRNFLFLAGNGEMQFESDHIKDKEGYVKIFDDKVVIDSGSLTISHPIVATDASLRIKDIDTSVLTSRLVDTSTLILSEGLDVDTIDVSVLNVSYESVTNLSAKKITIPDAILLKQVKELPSPDKTHAEEILQYIGPTQHESSIHIQKYDFVRCVMSYNAQNELDASVYLYTDFDSFEPTTTLKWLEDNNIPPVSTIGEVSEYEFALIWESDKYVVAVKNGDDDYVTIGGDIYGDHSSPKRHIYCPYVWDESYVPSVGTVLTYSITFDPSEYAWKPVR